MEIKTGAETETGKKMSDSALPLLTPKGKEHEDAIEGIAPGGRSAFGHPPPGGDVTASPATAWDMSALYLRKSSSMRHLRGAMGIKTGSVGEGKLVRREHVEL